MLRLVTPEPLAWNSVSSAIHVLLLVVLPAVLLPSSTGACCAEEQGPIRDCSFSHDQATFSCSIAEHGFQFDTCPDEGIASVNSIPGRVPDDSFTVTPYFTSCSPTDEFMYNEPLNYSSCHTSCSHGNGKTYAGLNITFRAEPWSSEDLRAITISLRYRAKKWLHCVMFRFDANSLTYSAALAHEFYYDGFIGLIPGGEYRVSILTLPTSNQWDNVVSKRVYIPYETCWVPDLKVHNTTFAVNLTLFEDLHYGFKSFEVYLYPYGTSRRVDFSTAVLYEMDGKNGTNVTFDCLEPSSVTLKLYVNSLDCPFCDWHETEVQVQGEPPKFMNCPDQDIVKEVELRKPMDDTAHVTWSLPVPVFQSRCKSGDNSSHDHLQSAFQVGTTTPVRYLAWQYSLFAECSFNVEVRAVDTIPPKIFCPDNITTDGNPKMKTLEVTWRTPTFDDASDTILSIITPDVPDNQTSYHFPVGVNTTVKYRITDAYNNVAHCSFSVYVKGDTDPPRITYCPRNIDKNGKPKTKIDEVHWNSPQFDDETDTIVTIISPDIPSNQTFYQFRVGVNTTVKYKITDAYNNSAYCSFYVYIEETPFASPLVIALSCLAGFLLILVLAVCAYCTKIATQRRMQASWEDIVGDEDHIATFSKPDYDSDGIHLGTLQNFFLSETSIDRNGENVSSDQEYPEHCESEPSMEQPDTGYNSREGEFIPSIPCDPPDSAVETENTPLVWVQRQGNADEQRSSCGSSISRYSDDDSQLESMC